MVTYDANFPVDTTYVSDVPGAIREKGRQLKDDKIVNAGKLDDKVAGNESGNIPVANGTVCSNLNADKVDGYNAADFVLKSTVNGIAFVMKNPSADEESARIKLKTNKTAIEVDVIANVAPSSGVNIIVYQNTTAIANFSLTTASMTYDINPDFNLSSGDVLYAKINGSVYGIGLITIQLAIKDR